MFEIGDEINEMFNVSLGNLQTRHDVMGIQGPFLTRMQHCVQRVEVSGGEQRSSCINEMHAISSTPIRTKNVRRGSPLHNPQAAARPSIYSVAQSPNVSPVGKSTVCLSNYSPSEREVADDMDAIVLSNSACGRESLVRIGKSHHMVRNVAVNDVKRNVSRRLPMATAIQRSEQYVPLEIVSDEDGSESKAFTKRIRSCRRPVNSKRKVSVHFKTNSYRGLSTKYDSIDSGRGGSAALSSGTRNHFEEDKHSNNGSDPEDPQSDSDSGLSHCTEGPSRIHCNREERMENLPSNEREEIQASVSPKFTSKIGKNRRVSRFLQPQYDYEPLEIVSDDDDQEIRNQGNRWACTEPKDQGKRANGPRNVTQKAGRRKLVEPDPGDDITNEEKLPAKTSFTRKILRENVIKDELQSKTVAIIDSLLIGEEEECKKENWHLKNQGQNSICHSRSSKQFYGANHGENDDPEIQLSESKYDQSYSESFTPEEQNGGSYRSMEDESGAEASRYNQSDVEGVDDDEVGEIDQDLSADGHNNKRDYVENSSSEEFDEHHGNYNTSGFQKPNHRAHGACMNRFVDDNTRTRYGESFDSGSQCMDMEQNQDAGTDNEDMDESGNVSGLQVQKMLRHKNQLREQQFGSIQRKIRHHKENQGNMEIYPSDNVYEAEVDADISGFTDYGHKRNVQAFIHSRNDSYVQQDSFNAESIKSEEAKRHLMSRASLMIDTGIIKGRGAFHKKGGMRKSVKKKVPPKVPSDVTIKQNHSCSRKQGRPTVQKLSRSKSSGCSEENDGDSYRQLGTVIHGGEVVLGRKRPRSSMEVANVPSAGKKSGKLRGRTTLRSKTPETAEFEEPPAKIKRGKPKTTKASKTLMKGIAESLSASSENVVSGSSSEARIMKNSQSGTSETTGFESSPVSTKCRRAKVMKPKKSKGKQVKGNPKSQSESSETTEKGTSPKKRKRGRPPLKTKNTTNAQNEKVTVTKHSSSSPEDVENAGNSSPPKERKRGRRAKTRSISLEPKEDNVSGGKIPSQVVFPATGSDQNPPIVKKSNKASRKNSKKQKVDPVVESLPKSSDVLQVSSSDSETDKTGMPKRRPLFSSEKFNNELKLNQTEGMQEDNERKTDPQPKVSPLRDRKKPAESSSDYLRKKVLTMRLGTSAFLNSVIEENALVVTSTPKKSIIESRTSSTSRVESISDEDKVNIPPLEGQLCNSESLAGESENNDKLNKSKGDADTNGPSLLPAHSNDDIMNKRIKAMDETAPASSSKGVAAKPESEMKMPEDLPIQSLKINDRLQKLPMMSISSVGLTASNGKMSSNKGLIPVVVDGSHRELELFGDYSKIAFRSRQKESKENGVLYGAALDVLGLGSGFIRLTPGTEKGLQHPKSYNMVFLILDGEIMAKIHESDIVAKPGDFFAVPKGCKYNLIGMGDKDAVVAYFKSKAA